MTWTRQSPPSVESRLNRVYPQPDDPNHTPGEIDFMWRISSEGQWFVTTGNGIQIKSSITEGV